MPFEIKEVFQHRLQCHVGIEEKIPKELNNRTGTVIADKSDGTDQEWTTQAE